MKHLAAFLACFALPASAIAQAPSDPPANATNDTASSTASQEAEAKDVRREVPIVAYTYSASGASAKTIGAQAYGLALAAPKQDGVIGGGGAIWGSPFDRLTIVVDGQRNLSRDFSPS